MHNLNVFRIYVFARLLNLYEENELNYNVDELKKFLEGYEFVTLRSQMGTEIPYNDSELVRYVPYIRCLDYLKLFLENQS